MGSWKGSGRVPEGAWVGSELLQEPSSPLSEPLPSGLDWVLYGVCIGRARVLRRRSCVEEVGELSLKLCFRRGILIFRRWSLREGRKGILHFWDCLEPLV